MLPNYDNRHRLKGVRYDPNTFDEIVYTNDTSQTGQLYGVSRMSSDGTYAVEEHSYTYDPMGRVQSETYGHRDSNTPQPASRTARRADPFYVYGRLPVQQVREHDPPGLSDLGRRPAPSGFDL